MLFAFILISLLACQSQQETKTNIKQDTLKSDGDSLVHFKNDSTNEADYLQGPSIFDSISRGDELSIAQIRQHTMIDSIYFTGKHSDAVFMGETVYDIHNGFKGAIIVYDDRRNCIYKFLLVFDPAGKNSDYRQIKSDCDRDESADFGSLDYSILNDSIFQTIETYVPADSEKAEKKKSKWKVNDKGLIVSTR